VVRIIRGSQTTDTARKNLIDRLKLSELQADAILEMPLKRLVALERRKIADEHKEKLAEIGHLTALLKSPAKIRGAIRDELLALKAKYGDPRRTQIADREKGHHTARELVQAQEVVLTLWQDGQLSMSNTAPDAPWRAAPLTEVRANTQDNAVVFTASGKAALMPLHQLPVSQCVPVSNLVPLDSSEKLVGMVALVAAPSASPGEDRDNGGAPSESYLILTTRRGRIKRVVREELASAASRGPAVVISVEEGDELAWVEATAGKDEVVLVTRQGQAIRFSEADVRPMGLAAAGVLAVKLEAKDAVVGMGIFRASAFVVTFTDAGYAKRTPVGLFPAQKRYGSGVQAAKCTTKTGALAVAALAEEEQDIVLTTARGRIARIAVRAVHPMGRAVAGHRTPPDSVEPNFEPDKDGPPTWLTVLPGSGKAAGGKPEKHGSGGVQEQAGDEAGNKKESSQVQRPLARRPGARGRAQERATAEDAGLGKPKQPRRADTATKASEVAGKPERPAPRARATRREAGGETAARPLADRPQTRRVKTETLAKAPGAAKPSGVPPRGVQEAEEKRGPRRSRSKAVLGPAAARPEAPAGSSEESAARAVLRSLQEATAELKKRGTSPGGRAAGTEAKSSGGKEAPDVKATGKKAPPAKRTRGKAGKSKTPPPPAKKPAGGRSSRQKPTKTSSRDREHGEQMRLPMEAVAAKPEAKVSPRKSGAKRKGSTKTP
jgi:hypothetical protein